MFGIRCVVWDGGVYACDWFHRGWKLLQSNQYVIILVKCLREPPLFPMIPFFTRSPPRAPKMRVIAERAPAVHWAGWWRMLILFGLGGGCEVVGGLRAVPRWGYYISLVDCGAGIGTYTKVSWNTNPDNYKSPRQPFVANASQQTRAGFAWISNTPLHPTRSRGRRPIPTQNCSGGRSPHGDQIPFSISLWQMSSHPIHFSRMLISCSQVSTYIAYNDPYKVCRHFEWRMNDFS